ncbi:DUF1330 domain-containing protein [Trinickia acidisoli]|uniref:DUF1330 domain-containing protein n=1 Tax=Trinickia acidisoli TaxID=2767482 RepID=UPI001A8F782F|nr:DUF1330 domain-containing protein [Trinickia acidisoli]
MASVVAYRSPIMPERLITAAQLRALLPPNPPLLALVRETREALARIVAREDTRVALIVGPCSVHDARAALDYAKRLAPLRDAYRDALEIVMRDSDAFAAYRRLGLPTIAEHGGRVLARSDEAVPLEGGWHPRRIVVLEFPSVEAAQHWHASPGYQAARQLRLCAGTTRSVAFEGLMA